MTHRIYRPIDAPVSAVHVAAAARRARVESAAVVRLIKLGIVFGGQDDNGQFFVSSSIIPELRSLVHEYLGRTYHLSSRRRVILHKHATERVSA
ncbi:hypothetical protein [Marispirochaeta sp.]|uniref:hypothetical protein n=1 Tax=Marispirochaeta sp. TaxID=2038653 RepID=UPI0029C9AB01|nr:hypothetical protein [Marispirochaeta sp.]